MNTFLFGQILRFVTEDVICVYPKISPPLMRYGHVNALNAALALLQDEESEVRASAADFVRGLPDCHGKFHLSQF